MIVAMLATTANLTKIIGSTSIPEMLVELEVTFSQPWAIIYIDNFNDCFIIWNPKHICQYLCKRDA
jgi:hypothetical protein